VTTHTTYTEARARFAELWDEVVDERNVVVISRRRRPKVALIAADELESLMETAHLLRSPKNASRLLTALNRALARLQSPGDVAELRRDVGLGEEEIE